jgi:predicted phage terminase large subunit-like protein
VLNLTQQEKLHGLAQNWRLTPATQAVKLTNGQWIAAPWLQYASMRIAHGIMRGGARIIISAPPRHGKTELVAVHTSTWVLENLPRRNVILTGYGSDLVEISARKVRDLIDDNEDVLRCRIRKDVRQLNAFQTETDGYMFSVGLCGAITGRGAHVLLIDDYIKEIKEALSQAHRDYLWNWFVTTAMTRLEPGASVIIIATRWHSDDLIGRIIQNFGGKWENICLPAYAGPNDILGRLEGEVLFPERYDREAIEAQRELLGSVFFHALYQQGPVDEVMKITNPEWLLEMEKLPDDVKDWVWARVWDLAATEGGGDYTCGTLVGYSKKTSKCVIANVTRRQLSSAQVEEHVRNIANADGEDVLVAIEQEPGSSGKSLVEHFQKTVIPDFKVVPVPATKAKLIRAQPFLAAAEAGKVHLLAEQTADYSPQGALTKWHQLFRKEFESFPGGQNDDQVDTAAAGYILLSGKKVYSATWGRRKKTGSEAQQNHRKRRQAEFMLTSVRGRKSRSTFGR